MRLKQVKIDNYKNLKDFTLDFTGKGFIEIFVGKNGSGKSNLLEALIEIFRHIYEHGKSTSVDIFNYTICYEIEGRLSKIEHKNSLFFLNDSDKGQKTFSAINLPENVLIYYSGHNDNVTRLVSDYEEHFRSRIKGASISESRRFVGIGPSYKSLLLCTLLLQPKNNNARDYVCRRLNIHKISSEVILKLSRPKFAEGRFRELGIQSIDAFDPRSHFWGADGITREFLEKLITCVKGEFNHNSVYDNTNHTYSIPIDIKLFQKAFADTDISDQFRLFDNLKTLGMLADISTKVFLSNEHEAQVNHFSDGQFQSIYIYAIVELFKDRDCLTLLDEPDAFLHPEWQFNFLEQIFDISENAAKRNHILMSSHSAATLCPLEEQSINLFKMDNANVTCTKRTKKEVISELSNSFIQYSEDESKLLIDNAIRSSSRPILFVEGPSDVCILNTALTKLYPNAEISILIQDAFDRGFIKILFARNEMFATYPNKHFFALFDFDDAYEDWRSLAGENVVTDIGRGLCRKLNNKNAYAFLLPIPNNELRAQVWDDANPNEKIRPNPHFCIEHIFWGVEDLEKWFRKDEKTGRISFKNDKYKVKFANEIVPTLDASKFEAFRPLFEFIEEKCNTSTAVS